VISKVFLRGAISQFVSKKKIPEVNISEEKFTKEGLIRVINWDHKN
jgi:hypothetical protein